MLWARGDHDRLDLPIIQLFSMLQQYTIHVRDEYKRYKISHYMYFECIL